MSASDVALEGLVNGVASNQPNCAMWPQHLEKFANMSGVPEAGKDIREGIGYEGHEFSRGLLREKSGPGAGVQRYGRDRSSLCKLPPLRTSPRAKAIQV